jgi:hypothetical protein
MIWTPDYLPARRASLFLLALVFSGVLFGCGLVTKNVPVTVDFQVGAGFGTMASTSVAATQITTPLEASAGELSSLSSVTLTSATLSSTDGKDLSFITGGTITLSGNDLGTVQLATLPAPGAVGTINFTIEQSTYLRAYLEAGGTIDVALTDSGPPVPARGLELTLNILARL